MAVIPAFFRSLGQLALGCTLVAAFPASAVASWTFADVAKQAKQLASERYTAPERAMPAALSNIDFAAYESIRQKPEAWLWGDTASPFRIELYHVGMHYTAPVALNIVDADGVRPVRYDHGQFDFGDIAFDQSSLEGSGIAGFRVRYPINEPGQADFVASFLGASYFQMVGAGQVAGALARGLAVDTGLPSGEQFPWFREFWLLRPGPSDRHLTLFALLDAPSVTGAYRFIIHPGEKTTVDVKAEWFFRNQVGKLGLAPLTSMFLHGANQPPSNHHFRLELHDSEGLSIVTANGEWLWRPLNNPRRLAISAFQLDNPRGFGLLQRTRDFNRYEDLDHRYDLRPGVWVEPQGDWGPGQIELVEIPSTDETNDNIVAFWTPARVPAAGESLSLSYRLHWTRDDTALMPDHLAWVAQTRRTPGEVRGADMVRKPDGTVVYRVDFAGGPLPALPEDAALAADVSHNGNVEIIANKLRFHPVNGGRRLTLRIKVLDPAKPVELRARLLHDGAPISEVWSQQIPNG